MIFFSADHHFGHGNIWKPTHANRPFTSTHEMNMGLVAAWNAVVGKKDTVYHLGDIAWGSPNAMSKILDRLNGTIHLILGNHDKTAQHRKCRERFASITDARMDLVVPDPEAHEGERLIVLDHYAMRVWNCSHWGSWQLYGHSHGNLPDLPDRLQMDVGVDTAEPFGTPYSYDQIKAIMARKTWTPPFKPREKR